MFGALDISSSALIAQRTRIDTVAGNIANAFSTEDPASGKPVYRRRVAVFEPTNPAVGRNAPGVHVAEIINDPSPSRYVHDPTHPHAIQQGHRRPCEFKFVVIEPSTRAWARSSPSACG